jgi:hypothetical protein
LEEGITTMIKISVYSPEDKLRTVEWPTDLEIRPLIGEWMSSLDGQHSRKIEKIEHTFGKDRYLGKHFLRISLQSVRIIG